MPPLVKIPAAVNFSIYHINIVRVCDNRNIP